MRRGSDGFAAPLNPQPLYQERFVIACQHYFGRTCHGVTPG
jgi:hypothetical protein